MLSGRIASADRAMRTERRGEAVVCMGVERLG
jgi:hypothetical protein